MPEYELDTDIIKSGDVNELIYENPGKGAQPGRRSDPLRGGLMLLDQ